MKVDRLECLDRAALRAPVDQVGRRDTVDLTGRSGLPDGDQPVRLGERQRTEQHAVDETEDRRVGADPERQRQHDGRCEAGAPPQLPDAIAHVLPKLIHDVAEPGGAPASF
ncbi:MAG: hypothetical protein QGI10_04785 [Vicinamibacterales bacterium]|jgi:hypothetical protein|nr:hypothetical protein [Vicinamibacterales bacterium]MDP7478562.1 hypothetical protein [Vicinamibacterales bacterium]MDP7693443.1 hypothetical protein [Vicinamibacterales bacterium]